MQVLGLKKLNAFTKKQPMWLLSVAFVLLVALLVSNALVFVGVWKRDQVIRKMKKWLLVARKQGLALSEDMTAELGLDEDENAMVEEVKKAKAEVVVSEGMEGEVKHEENEEEPVEEEVVVDEVEEVEEPFEQDQSYAPF
jgi:hypothetical protein